MIVLGLLLILLAAGGIALVSLEPTATASTATFTYFGYTVQPTHLEMFLIGAATAAVLLIGLAMISSGSRRAARRRKAVREARHEADDRVAQLENEKRRLEHKLETENNDHTDHAGHQPMHTDRETTRTDHEPVRSDYQPEHTTDHLVAGGPARRLPEDERR